MAHIFFRKNLFISRLLQLNRNITKQITRLNRKIGSLIRRMGVLLIHYSLNFIYFHCSRTRSATPAINKKSSRTHIAVWNCCVEEKRKNCGEASISSISLKSPCCTHCYLLSTWCLSRKQQPKVNRERWRCSRTNIQYSLVGKPQIRMGLTESRLE